MEALKASVEAARKSKTPLRARKGAGPGGEKDREDADELAKDEVLKQAKRSGHPGRSGMCKKELVRALKQPS